LRLHADSISWDFLEEKKISSEIRLRLSDSVTKTVPTALLSQMEDDGWSLSDRLKRSVKVQKRKTHDVAFEDKVWAAFAKLNFTSLNASRHFRLPYGDGDGERKQIDVFAADDEVVLVVECKSSAAPTKNTLKSEIEAMKGTRPGLIQAIKTRFPSHKIKFILATSNIALTQESRERIAQAGVVYMDEDAIDYFLELADHLGHAARYQLLGSLFAGTKIPELDTRVPALQSRMGGHTYYSFAIEPSRLLKIGYILHRNKASNPLTPTYQRLIKKTRLKKVSAFVQAGGFFPNSIIVNVESGVGAGKLQFDLSPQQVGESRAGILHLPQTYRAAFIIDGQHRLYGYGDSERGNEDLIPVVAFIDLPQTEQVELFMQINENQQPVPKNLRSILNANLLWESEDLRERDRALRLRIAQQLGESRTSPLFGRVIVGEEKRSPLKSITMEAISNGIFRSSFIGTFTKSEMKEAGTFYRGSNDNTFGPLSDFLQATFGYIREQLPTQWDLGAGDGGFVFINNGIEALCRLAGDIVSYLERTTKLNPRMQSATAVFVNVEPYLQLVVDYLGGLDAEQGRDLKRQYGSNGAVKYLRRLQAVIHETHSDFVPDGLREYLVDEAKEFNEQSATMITEIEQFLSVDVKKRLQEHLGARYFKDGVPAAVYTKASELAVEKNRTLDPDDEVEPWDCLYITDYQKIFQSKFELWEKIFASRYTKPGDESKAWKTQSAWMSDLIRIRNDSAHNHAVKETDFRFLVALVDWLKPGAGSIREAGSPSGYALTLGSRGRILTRDARPSSTPRLLGRAHDRHYRSCTAAIREAVRELGRLEAASAGTDNASRAGEFRSIY